VNAVNLYSFILVCIYKPAKMTIGVPMVTCLPKVYQQCTNRQKQSKHSQNSKNDRSCTNRHMSTQSPPNTQSPSLTHNHLTAYNGHTFHLCMSLCIIILLSIHNWIQHRTVLIIFPLIPQTTRQSQLKRCLLEGGDYSAFSRSKAAQPTSI